MKRLSYLLIAAFISGCLYGCSHTASPPDIAATTLPVYELTSRLCEGSGLKIQQIVTDNVSCLHDYSLQVNQMRAIEGASAVVISGAGLEDTMEDALQASKHIIDASAGIQLHHHDAHEAHDGHDHEDDPHIWLDPDNAIVMAQNISEALCQLYPQHETLIKSNLTNLLNDLNDLKSYGEVALSSLSCREIITFHDGFSYFAEAYDLQILHAIEEESGSEASAAELIDIISLIDEHNLTSIFVEENGAASAATIIAAETGAKIYTLDMAISGTSYLDAMRKNIDTIKEALE